MYKCLNKRAEMWWRMRDLLDPEGQYAGRAALPPDRELLQELSEAKYEIGPTGIKVEEKDKIMKRLKRSPDKADAVCLALLPPPFLPGHAISGGKRPQIVTR